MRLVDHVPLQPFLFALKSAESKKKIYKIEAASRPFGYGRKSDEETKLFVTKAREDLDRLQI